MKSSLLEIFVALGEAGKPVALATDLATGEQALVRPAGFEGELSPSPAESEEIALALLRQESRIIALAEREIFVDIWMAPARLIVVGGAHVAQALLPMAGIAGYAAILVEPRTAFGTPARFPGRRSSIPGRTRRSPR